MTQDELKRLQQAAQFIKAGDYQRARAILATMPQNEKAQTWLLKLGEKEMFDAPVPAPKQSSQHHDKTRNTRKVNPVKLMLMLLGVVVVIVVTTMVVFELVDRNRAYEMLPEAQTTMALFCMTIWEYSFERCNNYATKYFDEDIKRVFRVKLCSVHSSIDRFVACLGNELKLPAQVGA